MNSIEALEFDIELQKNFLKSFTKKQTRKKKKPLSDTLQKNSIFSGSGDSLVSAMLAESFSEGKIKAMDPLDLYKNKHLAKSKNVFFVSISGNTITNIKVAKIAKKATAITAHPKSRLAKASDEVLLLCSPNGGVFTAGSISFLESALTCISLVKGFSIPKNSDEIFSKAKKDAKKALTSNIKSSKTGTKIYILGDLFTYPLAMYCTAKFYEILGSDVHYCRIEQFSHMELFSAKKGDIVIIFEQKNPHNTQLVKNLKKVGIKVIHPNAANSDKISQILYYTFFSQFLGLFSAKQRSKKECYFVTAKKIRDVSNKMIY